MKTRDLKEAEEEAKKSGGHVEVLADMEHGWWYTVVPGPDLYTGGSTKWPV